MFFTDLALARRLEDAEMASSDDYARAKAALEPDRGAMSLRVGDGLAVFIGAGSPINRVHGLGMHTATTAADLQAAEAFFSARGEATRIDLCPLADGSLTALLLRRNYGVELFKQVWWRSLTNWAEHGADAAAQPDAHLRIECIRPEQRLLWAQVVSVGFGGGRLQEADVDIPLANAHKQATACFLAWVGDSPAGGGALAIHDGVAICYSASTRPAFRRLGIQRALLQTRLAYAVERGCDLASVSTTPGSPSQRNVERLVFRLAYTKPTVRSAE
jgi:GNAT superfamily N-acetyltransferase